MTIVLYGREAFWQLYCTAITLLKDVIKVWQLYCMAVKLFDNCTVWLWAQNRFDNFTTLSWDVCQFFDCHHALQMEKFSCKNHLRFFWQFYCMAVNFFDNCTVWLWTYKFITKKFDNCTALFFDNCTVWLFDNCTVVAFWQFSSSPARAKNIFQSHFQNC